jgi:DegV family protein with EDD domain
MEPFCIVTDNSVQFPQPAFPGRHLVKVINSTIQINGQLVSDDVGMKAADFPPYADDRLKPKLIPPSVNDFRHLFTTLLQSYHQILGIFLSSGLSGCISTAQEATLSLHGGTSITVIDSCSTSVGMGVIVQAAAELAEKGSSFFETEQLVRSLIPHIYTILCTPGPSYLYYNGFIDRAQAVVTEMLGLYPIFTLEEGILSSLEKVRNYRHVVDFYQEFLDEFDHLMHIALLQSSPPNLQEVHLIREHIQENFNKSPFTAHPINPNLAALLGPRTTALFVIESINNHHEI